MISATSWFTQLEFRRAQLGMSKTALAKRSGVSLPTVDRILAGSDHNPRLANVQAIAAALGVELRVGESMTVFEPLSAQEFRKLQASSKATRLVRMVQGSMGLEAQAVDAKTIADMIDQTTCELLAGSPRKLWDE